jgi:hypothetical protein
MRNKKITFKELISLLGGRKAVAKDLNLFPQVVDHWGERGLPKQHWPYIMWKCPEVTPSDLWEIEEELRDWSGVFRKRMAVRRRA